jgi:hypothetical protein
MLLAVAASFLATISALAADKKGTINGLPSSLPMGDPGLRNMPSKDRFTCAPLAQQASAPEQPTTQRPVIFLDIDGVLNRPSDKKHSEDHVVAADLLARFESLVSSSNARVVLASTWRHEPDGLQKARERGVPFEDVLPDLRPTSRGTEVKAWLAKHSHVDRFIIVDNDDDAYEHMPLFQPNPYKGLSPEDAVAIKEYLAGRRNEDSRRSIWIRTFQYLKSFFAGHRG